MSMSPLAPHAVSAPGKVFVAGGYLVLDRKHTALVFGLDARIHVAIEPIETKSGVTLSEVIVRSPQFRDARWEYGYRVTEGDGGIAVTQLRASHASPLTANPFISTALTHALTYTHTLLSTPLPPSSLTILASTPYYSNPSSPPPHAPNSPFADFAVPLAAAHKTGLGSSAALVTAFTAAVLGYYLPRERWDGETEEGKRVLHNLAQVSHCAAQGKVGSGFDIASAVYGSCLYRRFSPALVGGLPAPGDPGFAPALRRLVEGEQWDVEIRKSAVEMPRGLRLVMCDVDCGSGTPGMVKQVLAWRQSNPELADRIWEALQAGNEALAAELTHLASGDGGAAAAGREKYARLRDIIKDNRKLIREMSQASGVPIEPPQQTALLDACSAIPGVIGGVVPGAGGYDAIVLLLEDKEEVIAELRKLVEGWKSSGEDDGVKIGKVGILGVREDMVGVRREDLGSYEGWISNEKRGMETR